jgi:hypothetical protein
LSTTIRQNPSDAIIDLCISANNKGKKDKDEDEDENEEDEKDDEDEEENKNTNCDFRFNPNPRAVKLMFDEVKDCNNIEQYKSLLRMPYITDDMISYAEEKLKECGVVDELDEILYDVDVFRYRRSDPNAGVFLCGNPKHSLHKWFVKAVVRREFSKIFQRFDKCKGDYNEQEDTPWIDRRGRPIKANMTLYEMYRRLSSISDSDEVAEWFLRPSNHDIIEKCRYELSENPHPSIVQYFLDHPKMVSWSRWIKNPNPRTLEIKPTDMHGFTSANNTLYTIPDPQHMLRILETLETLPHTTMPYKINFSVILASFAKSNDVEVVFDTDVIVEFLSGEKMRFSPSMKESEIVKTIVKRLQLSSSKRVKLTCLDDNKYFAIISDN